MQRGLRVRQMQAITTLTPSSGSVSLPTDFLAVKAVTWRGGTVRDLGWKEAEEFDAFYGDGRSGTPRDYTIIGSTLYVGPVDNTNIRLVYYQKIPPLSNSNTTNWLLTAYPDLYLFATLTEMELFGKDMNESGTWKQRRDATLAEINTSDNFSFRGPSPSIRIVGRVNP